MKIRSIILFLFVTFSTTLTAQNISKSQTPKIVSIYTYSSFSKNKISFTSLNKRLNLNNLNFVFVNQLDLDLNQFSLQFSNFGRKPSSLIYDDYTAYRDENLLKGWVRKHDPTRWNLQCPNPLNVLPVN